jgi:hypothetical protein
MGETMILRGSIERFDLGSVLQFLAQNGATGILEIRDYEEHGHIYLVKGRLEAISLPVTDDRLGVFMVKRGLVAESQLTKVLMEEADGADGAPAHTPLGQRLADRGFVSVDVVRKAMQRLTAARMFELTQWRTGVFSYDEPEHMPEFKIAIQGNVQELLLQAQVRIDHGDRPRKRIVAQPQDDLCFGCTVRDCTPGVKLKYLKKDACLWRKMSSPPDVSFDSRTETRAQGAQSAYADEAKNEAALLGQWGQF